MSKFKKVFKAVKKIAKSPIAPLALSFLAPQLGTALGGALGATGAGASALGSGLLGAGMGALSGGGLKGALLGGLTSGAGGYIGAGGSVPGLGSIGGLKSAGTLAKGAMGPAAPVVSQGSGILGKLSGAISGAGAGGGSSLFSGSGLSNALSGLQSYGANEDAEKLLLKAQGKAASAIQPYSAAGLAAQKQLSSRLSAGFNPGDLTQDPGYQFNLNQGQRALDRAQTARGGYFSGAALKEASNYAQGLADNTYNDAWQRWNTENSQLANQGGQGLSAAGGLANIYDTTGDIQANALTSRNNIFSSTLSSILSGNGRNIIGRRPDGTPIYADEKLTQGAY